MGTNKKVATLPASVNWTPEQALQAALKVNLTEVLIIGVDEDDKLVRYSSQMKNRDALWLLEKEKLFVLNAAVFNGSLKDA